ncbi:hypothetical protein SAMN05518801_13411 [Novosphingobium sp. CF614]|uniref:hypothetical protein n=1 Tax=Novosphingobium sp. CF614 TaxID=1884364 RepID=UPI0008E1F956|nr:hypothetical protein [Novosphingobium sp. CF614]SFG48977.1 hypothetical protein SAMN05518801_13411 [Novosphingobium sp. CF614]
MGWFFAIGLAGLSLLALLASGRLPRAALEMAVAFLIAGLAGYAWQGSPDQPGHAVIAGKP